MKHFLLFLLALIVISCSSEDKHQEKENTPDESVDYMDLNDTIYNEEDDYLEGDIYTAWAAIDGPDEELWITTPEEFKSEEQKEIPKFEALHIVPEQSYNDMQDEEEWMMGIFVSDFNIWGKFGDHTGPVEVFYDGLKSRTLAKYNLIDGKPDGQVMVYTMNGNKYLDWEYDSGEWVKANYSPYGADWTFDQAASKLEIMDTENAMYTDEGRKQVEIMGTFRMNESDDNSLYSIVAKESFNNPFQINDEVFTGTLKAYWRAAAIAGELYYELNFTEGWLDGDIKIYNDWGELELHEGFVMGELDTTYFKLDYSEMDGMAKPIIYLYPEEDMLVNVDLKIEGKLTHTYPKYDNGWQVLARTDGTLFDENGKEYYALYWEGLGREDFMVNEGFVVPGEETIPFLERSLEILGLNRREANEFIVYWLPKLENNPYNLIHFSTKEYEEIAALNITPEPETLIRVMMVYQPLQEKVDLPVQDLSKLAKERKGFTVVEWGGSLFEEKVLP